jgi:hypothetical protein
VLIVSEWVSVGLWVCGCEGVSGFRLTKGWMGTR